MNDWENELFLKPSDRWLPLEYHKIQFTLVSCTKSDLIHSTLLACSDAFSKFCKSKGRVCESKVELRFHHVKKNSSLVCGIVH